MSKLEEHAKPIVLQLINSRDYNFTPKAQQVFACWAAKIAMIAEHVRPRDDGIAQADRAFLKSNQKPPEHWFLWVASYSGSSWPNLAIHQSRGNLQDSAVSKPHVVKHYIQTTTFVIGHLLVLVAGPFSKEIGVALAQQEREGFLQIWPKWDRSILWPPTPSLNDPEANAVANFLTLSGIFDQSINPLAGWTFSP